MKKDSSEAGQAMGKSHYMFWVFTAIILLAFWSVFTGSLTLKWSAPNLSRFSYDLDYWIPDDLDVLDVEERKKLVKRMWDVYTHSNTIRLPRFWSAAFEAAYEHLVSDVPGVRDSAISEIAQMSLRSFDLDILPLQFERKLEIDIQALLLSLVTSSGSECEGKLSKQGAEGAVQLAMTDNKNPSFLQRPWKADTVSTVFSVQLMYRLQLSRAYHCL